jgi:hypothetical protein
LAKKHACILTDSIRSMTVGRFKTLKEALAYAEEEGILKMTWEFVKEEN